MELGTNKVFLGLMTWKLGHGHLEKTIYSILNQSYSKFTLYIYDDCSPIDPTEDILKIISRDKRVNFHRGTKRLGYSGASQFVLDQAPSNTTFFAWVSDHDLYHPHWLERLIHCLEKETQSVVAYPLVTGIDGLGNPNNRKPTVYQNSDEDIFQRINSFLSLQSGAGNIIWGLFRYSSLIKVGGWPKIAVPDIILLARLSILGSISQVPETLYIRRDQDERSSAHSQEGMIARQFNSIFPEKKPIRAYIEHRIFNSFYLLYTEPLKAVFKKDMSFGLSFFLWRRYNAYLLKALINEIPKRIFFNRFTRRLIEYISFKRK